MLAEEIHYSVRDATGRFFAGLVGWIPDVNKIPMRNLVAIGIGAAVLLHLFLLLVAIIVLEVVFSHHVDRPVPSAAVAPPKPLSVQLVPMPDKAVRPEPKRTELLGARGLDAPEEKIENPDFESDKDTRAASQAAPTGILPLPSQDGRTDLPSQD